MRSAEETLDLFTQALEKRRSYVRRRLNEIQKQGRKRQPDVHRALRGGMLSELSTVECALKLIQLGSIHPDQLWNVEDDIICEDV